MKNKTKEAALAAVMLALFFVVRTFKIPVVPGVFLIDLSPTFVYTAAAILSWPYTLVFALSNLYLGSNIFPALAHIVGTQVVFFLSKTVPKKWIPHIIVTGPIVSIPTYGIILHVIGWMNFQVYLMACGIPAVLIIMTTYIGGLVMWRVLRSFDVID